MTLSVLRRLVLAGGVVLAPGVLRSQSPPAAAAPLDWWVEDSGRVAYLTAHGRSYTGPQAIVWAPIDSLDARWLAAFVDSLATGVGALRRLIGGPQPWQRNGERPITFYLSPGRFVSHASGTGAVFISLARVRQGNAPYLHEAAHELLASTADSLDERDDAVFPLWLTEGLPDYLAQVTATATGFHEGDVFAIGGLAQVDSVCAARLAGSPRREEILATVGGRGVVPALFTTERTQVAPVFYACSQSFTKYVVDRVGVRAVVTVFPNIPAGRWAAELETAAGVPLGALRANWLRTITKGAQ